MNENFFKSLPDPMSVNDVATLLNVTSETVYRWIKKKKLGYFQANYKGVIRITKKDFVNFYGSYHHSDD